MPLIVPLVIHFGSSVQHSKAPLAATVQTLSYDYRAQITTTSYFCKHKAMRICDFDACMAEEWL